MANKGGIDVVVAAMRRHEASAEVALWGCRALWNIACDGALAVDLVSCAKRLCAAANRVPVARKGGIDAVVAAMRRHEDNAAVAEQGCAALCNIAADGRAATR